MRLHRNAKTTPKMRQLLIERVTRRGWTQVAAATAAGISVRTVAKWIQRARQGDEQLEDASSRPHRQPRTLDLGQDNRHPGLSAAAGDGVGDQRARRRAPLDGRAGAAARRTESAKSAGPAAGDSAGTSGPTRAISCISISSRSVGFAEWAIAFTGTCPSNIGASATRTCDTLRSTTRRVSPLWKSVDCNAAGPVRRFCGMHWPGFVVAASRSAGCSPTTARATSRDGSPASVARGSSGIASPGPIRLARMAKRNASFRRCSANGPTATPSSARRGGRRRWCRTSASITTGVPMRASVGARRGCVSKRLRNEQPL